MSIADHDRIRVEQGHKRIRALLGGEVVADTVRPSLVWEVPYYPAYYLPKEDIRATLEPTGRTEHSPSSGDAHYFDVRVADQVAKEAAWRYPDSPLPELRELVRLDWDAMDEWLEEDEPVYFHPRDPYTRVDILSSSRHVRVAVDGTTVAESRQPTILFETGLPPRYYLPLADIRLGLLRPSSHQTRCPYKGTASYWHLEVNGHVHENVVWIYRTPLSESARVAGLACFWTEKLELYVDGVRA